jgi:hypothetical protein
MEGIYRERAKEKEGGLAIWICVLLLSQIFYFYIYREVFMVSVFFRFPFFFWYYYLMFIYYTPLSYI